jgi:hypothetical protein
MASRKNRCPTRLKDARHTQCGKFEGHPDGHAHRGPAVRKRPRSGLPRRTPRLHIPAFARRHYGFTYCGLEVNRVRCSIGDARDVQFKREEFCGSCVRLEKLESEREARLKGLL